MFQAETYMLSLQKATKKKKKIEYGNSRYKKKYPDPGCKTSQS